jgi:hypothetical protein
MPDRFPIAIALRKNPSALTREYARARTSVRKLMGTQTVQEKGWIANQAFIPESSA